MLVGLFSSWLNWIIKLANKWLKNRAGRTRLLCRARLTLELNADHFYTRKWKWKCILLSIFSHIMLTRTAMYLYINCSLVRIVTYTEIRKWWTFPTLRSHTYFYLLYLDELILCCVVGRSVMTHFIRFNRFLLRKYLHNLNLSSEYIHI